MGDALPEQMVDGGGEGSRPARGEMVGETVGELVRTDKGDEGGLVDGGSEKPGADDDNEDTSIVSNKGPSQSYIVYCISSIVGGEPCGVGVTRVRVDEEERLSQLVEIYTICGGVVEEGMVYQCHRSCGCGCGLRLWFAVVVRGCGCGCDCSCGLWLWL